MKERKVLYYREINKERNRRKGRRRGKKREVRKDRKVYEGRKKCCIIEK